MIKRPIYRISIRPELSEDGEELQVWGIANTDDPAIGVKGVALQAYKFEFVDEVQGIVAAPIIIPNMPMPRRDKSIGEYYVEFSEEDTAFIAEQVNRDKRKFLFNLDHDSTQISPSFLMFNWIVEDPDTDLSFTKYGVKVPKGTWFGVEKFDDLNYFKTEIIGKNRTGFSVEGLFALELKAIKKNALKALENVEVFVVEPRAGETQDEFVSRCIGEEINNGHPQDQAIAICYSKWENKNYNKIEEKMEQKFETLKDGEYMLPDGTKMVVVDGMPSIVKTEQEPVEDVEEMANQEQMAEPTPAPEVAPVAVDEEAIMAVVQPVIDQLLAEIAKLKTEIESKQVEQAPAVAEQAMSKSSRLEAFSAYLSATKKNKK